MIHNRNADRVEWAIRELAIKLTKREMNEDHKIRFVSSIMNVILCGDSGGCWLNKYLFGQRVDVLRSHRAALAQQLAQVDAFLASATQHQKPKA